jgi:hypothetical protein
MNKQNGNQPSLGIVERTSRNFEIINFKDRYKAGCSLQMSSLADSPQPGISAVWLGIDEANPQVLASDAHKLGIKTTQTTGWIPYPVPKEVLLTTRMHLDREQVAALINHLKSWLETGTFKL